MSRSAAWTAAAAALVLAAAVTSVPLLRSTADRAVLQVADPEPTASAAPWVTDGAQSARICRSRYGRCVEVTARERLDELTSGLNAAEPAKNGCGGGEPDLVVLVFHYADDHGERVTVNLDCDLGTASVEQKQGRALDQSLREAVLAVAPADYGDPTTLEKAYGPAPSYPGRPWQKDRADVPSSELVVAALPSHCNWQAAAVLDGSGVGRRQFIRDPGGALDFRPELRAGFRAGSPLPVDAQASGYSSGRFELWLAASDPDAAWLVNSTDPGDTERWPAPAEGVACA